MNRKLADKKNQALKQKNGAIQEGISLRGKNKRVAFPDQGKTTLE